MTNYVHHNNMKELILVVFSFLLVLFASMVNMEQNGCAVLSTRYSLSDDTHSKEIVGDVQPDILYDQDVVTLLTTYSCQNDDVMPCRMNQLVHQLRVFASRLQLRCQLVVLLLKKLTRFLSEYLTTLINHISQFYSSVNLCCWQYAADCYVFAFRQIVI